MVELTTLTAGAVRLQLAPAFGGGIARLDVAGLPVLRPWQGAHDNPFSLASNILVPFSNRISGGGFDWNGEHHSLLPNLNGEAFPIHGDGFQRKWSARVANETALLTLSDGAFGPWRYSGEQRLELSETAMIVTLSVTNTGGETLPFGCGFHPWFPRNDDTRLRFDARNVWMEDKRHLPTEQLPLRRAIDWSFSSKRALPETLINNGYTGWSGTANIEQGPDAVSCMVSASSNLDTALVYSPDAGADFFCFEPVSHPVDAFHLPGYPGLQELRPNETLCAQMQISWSLT